MELVVRLNKNTSVCYSKTSVFIETDNLNKVNVLLKNKKYIEKQLEDEKNIDEIMYDDNLTKMLEEIKAKPLQISDFKKLTIDVDDINKILEVEEFIKNYNSLIFININTTNFSYDSLEKLKNLAKSNKILVKHEYNNDNYYLLDEFISTMEYAYNIKKLIERFNLSKLEQLMFIYDYVKDRQYKTDENYDNPRDLSRIIKQDSIVCAGFANMFSSIANFLGIKTEKRYYYSPDNGHVTNICYVNDSKYNYNGVLEFDVTWDSKKHVDDPNYDRYIYYGLSYKKAEDVKKTKNLLPANDARKNIFDFANRMFSLYEMIKVDTFAIDFLNKALIICNKLDDEKTKIELINLINKIKNKEKYDEKDVYKYKKYIDDLLTNGINSACFIKTFLQTRRVEHFLNPKKYCYDEKTLFKVLNSKYKTKDEEEFLVKIFGKDYYHDLLLDKILDDKYFSSMDMSNKEKLKFDKERLELANVICKIEKH